MGSNDFYTEEQPVHEVMVVGFWMDNIQSRILSFASSLRPLVMSLLRSVHRTLSNIRVLIPQRWCRVLSFSENLPSA
jgi:hypothetical protein